MLSPSPSPPVLTHHLVSRAYPRPAIRSASSAQTPGCVALKWVPHPPYSARSSLRLGSTLVAPLFFDTPYALKLRFVGQLVGHMSDNRPKTRNSQQQLFPEFVRQIRLFCDLCRDCGQFCRTTCRTYVGQPLKNPHFSQTTLAQICPTN